MFKLKRMKKVMSRLLIFILLVSSLVGCSSQTQSTQSQPQPGEAAKEEPKISESFVGIGTSSSGGIFNTLGVAMSQLWIDKIPGVKFSAQVTGGSGENTVKLGKNELELAIISASTVYEAMNGLAQFEGNKVENLRAVANLYPAIIQMPVLKKSNINNMLDIKGKKINIGQAGSGSEATTLSLLESLGIDLSEFNPQRLSHGNAADAVVDEKMDGYINLGGLGQGHQMKAMSSGKVKIVPFEPADLRKKFLEDYPYYYEFIIPANAYPEQDYEVPTVATSTLLVAREEVSEELVYQVTKQLFENLETLINMQSAASEIKLENALSVAGIPLHPGAERYFKEIGLLK